MAKTVDLLLGYIEALAAIPKELARPLAMVENPGSSEALFESVNIDGERFIDPFGENYRVCSERLKGIVDWRKENSHFDFTEGFPLDEVTGNDEHFLLLDPNDSWRGSRLLRMHSRYRAYETCIDRATLERSVYKGHFEFAFQYPKVRKNEIENRRLLQADVGGAGIVGLPKKENRNNILQMADRFRSQSERLVAKTAQYRTAAQAGLKLRSQSDTILTFLSRFSTAKSIGAIFLGVGLASGAIAKAVNS